MTTKQAVVLWASGCLTAVLMFALFHTVLRTELVAARQMVVKSQKLHEDVRAILSGVPALMAGVEQAASGIRSLGQMVEHLANRVSPIERNTEQLVKQGQDTSARLEELITKVEALEKRLVNLGHRESNP